MVIEDRRERGFIVLHRRVRSSDLWRSLRGDQRGVLVTLLLLANWKPAKARWKGEWFEVGRGELAHSLASIAEEAGASVAVVRSTLQALMADDRPVGGNGPAVTDRYPIPRTGPGTGPRVLTIVNYDRYQSTTDEDNAGPNTDPARTSHGLRTDLAEREPRKPDQPGEPGGAGGGGDNVFAEVLEHLRKHVRPEVFRRVFAHLTGYRRGDTLVVVSPTKYQADFVSDNHAATFTEALSALNHPLQLEFTVAARRAAGGA